MKKITCIIRPSKLEGIKERLSQEGVTGLTVTHVIGCGNQQGRTALYRGTLYEINLLPKVKIEILVKDENVEKTLQAIMSEAKTGNIGDGKIYVSPIDDVVRIRTGERGEKAL